MKTNFRSIVFVVVGGLLFVTSSARCQTWQATTAPLHVWNGVASSADATKLVVGLDNQKPQSFASSANQ